MDSAANNYNPNANTALEYGGEADNTFSSGSYYNGNQHLIFDASTDLVIKSAVFYAEDPKTITFELRSSNGTVIDDTTHNVIQGQQQLSLKFEVPMGAGMELGISNGGSSLYRNDDDAVYPYDIGSIMSITGNSASDPDYYYFYYNIEVEVPCLDIVISSWDCDAQGNCFDPGTGNGQYIFLAQCESSCIHTEVVKQIDKHKRTLMRVIDILGRDVNGIENEPLFYIYDDGTVEKRIIVE
jgi:hypothetical protein